MKTARLPRDRLFEIARPSMRSNIRCRSFELFHRVSNLSLPKVVLALLSFSLCAIPAKADNQIIVRTTLGLQGLQQLCLTQNCSVARSLGDPQNQLFLLTTPLDPTTFLNTLLPLPGIVDAELDQLISLVGGLNVVPTPLPSGLMSDRSLVSPCGSTQVWNSYANQPATTIVHVQQAQTQFCGAGVVADIDTGVDPNHPAFAGLLLTGYDFTRNQQGASELNDINPSDFPTYPPPPCTSTSCPSAAVVNQSSAAIVDQSSAAIVDQNPKYAAFGHGTMVMGVIHLVAPKAMLLPLKAFHSDGTGNLSDILRAIYYAVQNGANVINMSFDFKTSSSEIAAALQYANQSTLIAGASAGNDGQKEIVYPAALETLVMGVASTSDLDTRSSFSNYGNAIVWVAAPGEAIVTTYPFATYAAGWGTSFSAPFVSGTASLLLNKQSKTDEAQAAAAVAHAVAIGSDMGNGRLDIVQALQALSPADFLLSAAPASTTINSGQTATYTVTLMPAGGFNQAVTLSCSGLPASSACLITPPAVTLDGTNNATATVSVQTTARASTAAPATAGTTQIPPWEFTTLTWTLSYVIWLGLGAMSMKFFRNTRLGPVFLSSLGLVAVLITLNSCGGSGNSTSVPPPQSTTELSSLALNPATAVGGSSATGTVTLTAPAPSGGTAVSLSTSNTAVAMVPASITVPVNATSTTFTVGTHAVTASTAITVSASYAGVTQTGSLTVTPPPAPGTPAGTYTLTITGNAGNLSHATTVSLVVN